MKTPTRISAGMMPSRGRPLRTGRDGGSGDERGDDVGDDDGPQPAQAPPHEAHILETVVLAFGVRFDQGDEADHGGERHLEARIEQALWRDDENEKCRECNVAHVSAGRSSSTAISTMLIMIQERTVGTAAPDRRR